MTIVMSFGGLCLLLCAAHLLRMHVRLLRRLYLPSAVIGGLLGLILIQTLKAVGAPLPEAWTAGWRSPTILSTTARAATCSSCI